MNKLNLVFFSGDYGEGSEQIIVIDDIVKANRFVNELSVFKKDDDKEDEFTDRGYMINVNEIEESKIFLSKFFTKETVKILLIILKSKGGFRFHQQLWRGFRGYRFSANKINLTKDTGF